MSSIIIKQSTESDLDTHMQLYDVAIQYQKQMGHENWSGFERDKILQEIKENKQFKIIVKDDATGKEEVGCVFLLEEADPLIWGEKDKDPSIYIHRVATNPKCRGNNFIKAILDFIRNKYKGTHFQYIRMDTKAGNDKLNAYYVDRCGFTITGEVKIQGEAAASMPKHYDGIKLTLFEMKL